MRLRLIGKARTLSKDLFLGEIMQLKYFILLVLSVLASSICQADALHYTDTDFEMTGNAAYSSSTDEFQLTQDATNQAGNLLTKHPICAKEYKISFDVFPGDKNANQNGGAGIVWYEVDTKTNGWASVVELNTQDRARTSNYNFMELFNFGVSPNVLKAQPVPFSLGGSGYSHIDVHINESVATALLTNPKGVAAVANQRTFTAGNPINHRFYAWTGVAKNRQAIRNIKVQIIRPDNCSGLPSLSEEEANQDVLSVCGADSCINSSAFFSCAIDKLASLKQVGVIDGTITESLTNQYQNKLSYCNGNIECKADLDKLLSDKFDEGFSGGVLSVDKDAIYKSGFDAGVKSVPVEELKKASYDDGFSAGVKSIDVEAIKNVAFNNGAASINQKAIRQSGYDEGYKTGLSSAPSCEKEDERKKWNLKDSIKVTPNERDCADKQEWTVRNNNKFPVQASYRVKRTGERGTITLKPGDNDLRVRGDSDPDSLEIIINDELHSRTDCKGFKKQDNKKNSNRR